MKKTHTLTVSATLMGLLLSSFGCEIEGSLTAESTEKYIGTDVTKTIDWSSGQDLQIDSRNGKVDVVVGNYDSITVLFEPFTFRGPDEEEEAKAEMDNSLVKSVDYDSNGAVFVYTQKDGPGSSSLGANITVAIPPDFDAGIFIGQDGSGDVHIDDVGEAIQIGIEAGGVSDCIINAAATVVNSQIRCGAVKLDGVSGHVDVRADFLDGNAWVRMASVQPDNGDNVIYTDDGDIVLTLPSDEAYVVQALVASGTGVVNTGNIPDGCDEAVAAEASKTVSCGDGPWFDLQAGRDEVGEPNNIELRYE